MAQFAQQTREGFYCDVTILNNEASASMTKGMLVKIDTATYASAQDPIPCVKVTSSDAATTVYGVVVDDTIKAQTTGRVCIFGVVDALVGTSGITANDLLIMDVTVTYAGSVATLPDAVVHVGKSCGRALHTGAAGEKCKIFFNVNACTTA